MSFFSLSSEKAVTSPEATTEPVILRLLPLNVRFDSDVTVPSPSSVINLFAPPPKPTSVKSRVTVLPETSIPVPALTPEKFIL